MVGSKLKALWLLLPIFLISCSTAPKRLNTEQREDYVISSILDGQSSDKLSKKPEKSIEI
jgi:starvation-inducible outer membrane lipoprotein